MVATERKQELVNRTDWTPAPSGDAQKVRVEIVDNWHKEWPTVLGAIDRNNLADRLMLDRDGWLSARQTVMAAFAGDRVVGHLSFHVAPIKHEGATLRTDQGRPALEARLDAIAVERAAVEAGVEQLLIRNAEAHALMLQCRAFRHDGGDCS